MTSSSITKPGKAGAASTDFQGSKLGRTRGVDDGLAPVVPTTIGVKPAKAIKGVCARVMLFVRDRRRCLNRCPWV